MDNIQWKQLRSHLEGEISKGLLVSLTDKIWDEETNKKADAILSRRAAELMVELNLPPIPKDHKLFAHLWFKKNSKELRISMYHVPWNRSRGKNNTSRPKPVSLPLKAEDPLGVLERMMYVYENYTEEYIQAKINELTDGLALPLLRLKDLDNARRRQRVTPSVDVDPNSEVDVYV